jgi:hypothetical protein
MTPEEVTKLLNLASVVAAKARRLIPRSANRVTAGDADERGNARDTRFAEKDDDVPAYVHFQVLAQRARKARDPKGFRGMVAGWNKPNQFTPGSSTVEGYYDKNFREDMAAGLDKYVDATPGDVEAELHEARRARKKSHANGRDFTPMEQEEAHAKNAVRYQVGNCEECAALALVMFAEYPGPGGDPALPSLPADRDLRPRVEKLALGGKYDHAFVVLNRPDVEPAEVRAWLKSDVIICDPWWFHEGAALRADDRSDARKRDLLLDISKALSDKEIGRCTEIRLGDKHSPRFVGKEKYGSVDYYKNPVEQTAKQLRV